MSAEYEAGTKTSSSAKSWLQTISSSLVRVWQEKFYRSTHQLRRTHCNIWRFLPLYKQALKGFHVWKQLGKDIVLCCNGSRSHCKCWPGNFRFYKQGRPLQRRSSEQPALFYSAISTLNAGLRIRRWTYRVYHDAFISFLTRASSNTWISVFCMVTKSCSSLIRFMASSLWWLSTLLDCFFISCRRTISSVMAFASLAALDLSKQLFL